MVLTHGVLIYFLKSVLIRPERQSCMASNSTATSPDQSLKKISKLGNKSLPPKIAIIGTEGTGKTVFVTVWASLLKENKDGITLIPNGKTLKYINNNWSLLQQGEWPESTPSTTWTSLEWTLHTATGNECIIHLADVAGHDIRRVFADSPLADDDSMKRIHDFASDAMIIFFLINLKQLLSRDDNQRNEDEATLLTALQRIHRHGQKACFIFSQWTDCQDWVKSQGGLDAVFSKCLPCLHAAGHILKMIPMFGVSSVVETEMRMDEDGRNYPYPKRNFTSLGFDKLNKWLVNTVDKEINLRRNKTWGQRILIAAIVAITLFIACWIGSCTLDNNRIDELQQQRSQVIGSQQNISSERIRLQKMTESITQKGGIELVPVLSWVLDDDFAIINNTEYNITELNVVVYVWGSDRPYGPEPIYIPYLGKHQNLVYYGKYRTTLENKSETERRSYLTFKSCKESSDAISAINSLISEENKLSQKISTIDTELSALRGRQ